MQLKKNKDGKPPDKRYVPTSIPLLAAGFFLRNHLYKHPVTVTIIFSELFWCAAFFLFKQAIEIGDIIEAAIVGYFGY